MDHTHKFVINDQDIIEKSEKDDAPDVDTEAVIEMLLKNFEPETDLLDRRILYEVTRMRLNEDEFKDEDSSDSSQEPPDDDAHALTSPKVEDVLMLNETFYSDDEEGSV